MIDWLKESLKAAEPESEAETENELLSLGFLTTGAFLRAGRSPAAGRLRRAEAALRGYGPLDREEAGVRQDAGEEAEPEAALAEVPGSLEKRGLQPARTPASAGEEAALWAEKVQGAALTQSLAGQLLFSQTEAWGGPATGRTSHIGSALHTLYRRAGEAVRAGAPHPAAPPGVTVLQESSGAPAGLTAEELDRAVRRDSRRYDGGMSIY